jgi:putative nucleotidyltransferase with HDIG domain
MDGVLESLLEASLELLSAPVGYVVMIDRETGSRFLRALRGAPFPSTGVRRSSIAEWVFTEHRPLVVNPSDWGGPEGDAITGARAAIAVMLVAGGLPIGVLVVGDTSASRRFDSEDVRLLGILANQAASSLANAETFGALQSAYLDTVRSLAMALDAKDSYTGGHSDRVATLAMLVADRIGLSEEDQLALEFAAYLHDIGKIGVRREVLHKPGRLEPEEFAEIKRHPGLGASILEPVAFPWPIVPVVRYHHERWDGAGYPEGLKGEQIPLLARILTVVDSHEAMVSDRPYRAGLPEAEAVAELRRCAGSQFDERIVDVFCDALASQGAGATQSAPPRAFS